MIVERRTYGLAPGGPRRYVERWTESGRGPQVRHLGEPLAVFTTEIGEINDVTYLWSFTDHDDRESRRRALAADPDFAAFRATVRDLMVSQRNEILTPIDGTAFALCEVDRWRGGPMSDDTNNAPSGGAGTERRQRTNIGP